MAMEYWLGYSIESKFTPVKDLVTNLSLVYRAIMIFKILDQLFCAMLSEIHNPLWNILIIATSTDRF